MSDQVDKKDVMVQILLAQLKDKHKIISVKEKEQQDKILSEQKLKEEQSPWINPPKSEQDQNLDLKPGSQDENQRKNKTISNKISSIGQEENLHEKQQIMDYTNVINGIAQNFSSIIQGIADQISISVGNQLKQEFYKQRQFLRQQQEKKINKSKKQKFQNQVHVEFMKPNLIQETLQKENKLQSEFQETMDFNQNKLKKLNEKFENSEKTLENNSKKKQNLQQSQISQSYASQNQFEPYESEQNQKQSSVFQKNESELNQKSSSVFKKNESEYNKNEKQQSPNFEFFEDIDDLLE